MSKKRTKFDPNEIILYDTYAEIILYDINNNEKARALIDISDIDRVSKYKWRLKNDGYVATNINSKQIYLHRYILGIHSEEFTFDRTVDHINRDKLDNRSENLRIVTQAENNDNRDYANRNANRNIDYANRNIDYSNVSIRSDNTSGVKGVCYHKQSNGWLTSIQIKGKRICKYFKTKEQAIIQRREWEIEYYGSSNIDI